MNYHNPEQSHVSPLVAKLDAEIKSKQELREIAIAVEAGAEWEHVGGGAWYTPEDQSLEQLRNIMSYGYEVRLKPKPVTRPWSKPEDVPGPVCWLRKKGDVDHVAAIVGISPMGITTSIGLPNDAERWLKMHTWSSLNNREHSTDRINWKPCETTEEAK